MTPAQRAELELSIKNACASGDDTLATTVALRGYGEEILGFLRALHADESVAADVFSQVAEAVWRGMGHYDWRSSFRAWVFGIARRASLRARRDAGRRARREVALDLAPQILAIADAVRTETQSFLRTDGKNRFRAIRDALPEDERTLLWLRADQGLAWIECARALAEDDDPGDDASLQRVAARLRKRYQALKQKLLEIGLREGLVHPPDDAT